MSERRLLLIRHAKAEQGTPDRERRLAARGVRDARALGAWLAAEDLVPDRAVVSPSRRTLETWATVAAELSPPPSYDVDDRIYDNSVDDLLAVVRDAAEGIGTLALVGHNPSVHELAARLTSGAGPLAGGAAVPRDYPTSSVAVIGVDTAWSGLDPDACSLLAFRTCRG